MQALILNADLTVEDTIQIDIDLYVFRFLYMFGGSCTGGMCAFHMVYMLYIMIVIYFIRTSSVA